MLSRACLKESLGDCASWMHKTLWYGLPVQVHQPLHGLDVLKQYGACTWHKRLLIWLHVLHMHPSCRVLGSCGSCWLPSGRLW